MSVYEVFLSRAARKQLAILPAFIHNKIIEDISGRLQFHDRQVAKN